jgi:exopolysaccharide biosynthesis predicted pyruvyltransferase EpsI
MNFCDFAQKFYVYNAEDIFFLVDFAGGGNFGSFYLRVCFYGTIFV